MKTVYVHLQSQSEPVKIEHVANTYTKDGLFCVLEDRAIITARRMPDHAVTRWFTFEDHNNYVLPPLTRIVGPERVWKFPVQHIFRILEEER